jgi:HdeA/HdeB family
MKGATDIMPIPSAKIAAVLSTMLVVLATGAALAQEKDDRSVDQYLCKDIMRDSGASRDVAIAFIHAYLLGRANATTFNVAKMRQQNEAFINRCLDNPNEKALDAMMKVKG